MNGAQRAAVAGQGGITPGAFFGPNSFHSHAFLYFCQLLRWEHRQRMAHLGKGVRKTVLHHPGIFFEQQIANGTLMPYPDNYLLIENSFIQEPWNLEQLIFDLQVKGYKLIMAHPERYLYYHTRPQRYQELKQLGIDFQVNLLSLAGYYGKNEKRMAERLVEAGMVDFMGTDTHGFRHLECFGDYLSSREAERHARLLDGKIKNSIFD